jgi:hypothetical protein
MELRKTLRWPEGWRRTTSRSNAKFDMSLDRAIASLREEIRMLGGREPVLTYNLRTGNFTNDPGVAVYFALKGEQKVFACDRWTTVRDNVRAITLTIGALRGITRWGASDMMERAFTGFDALPAPPDCWAILGITPGACADAIRAAHKRLVAIHHPDRGGSPTKMAEVNAARDAALRLTTGD